MADFLWVEKYRPKTVKDCILSNDLKKTFTEFVKKKEMELLFFKKYISEKRLNLMKIVKEEKEKKK